jgi:hypothetical protein
MTLATLIQQKEGRPPQTLGIGPQTLKNFRLTTVAHQAALRRCRYRMTKKELVRSKLGAVDEPETWEESVRELREVNVHLGALIDDLERRLAALEARDTTE